MISTLEAASPSWTTATESNSIAASASFIPPVSPGFRPGVLCVLRVGRLLQPQRAQGHLDFRGPTQFARRLAGCRWTRTIPGQSRCDVRSAETGFPDRDVTAKPVFPRAFVRLRNW